MTTTASTARYSVDKIDGEWTVIRADATGRQGVGTHPSRELARQDARERSTQQATDNVAEHDKLAAEDAQAAEAREDDEAFAAAERARLDAIRAKMAAETDPEPEQPKAQRTGESVMARKLQPGHRITLRGAGVITVSDVAKVRGQQKVRVCYRSEAGVGSRELWVNSRYSIID